MRVEFLSEALEDSSSFRYLTDIAWLFQDDRHSWVVPNLRATIDSAWLRAEGFNNKRRFEEMATKAARRHERPDVRVCPSGTGYRFQDNCWHVSADRAASALREPLQVVVEDETCDGAFLQKVVLRLGERKLRRRLGDFRWGQVLERWITTSGDSVEIKVNHGGGARTPQVVASLAEGEPKIARRVLVLVDSDRSSPDSPLGGTAQQVKQKCDELTARFGDSLHLRCWILAKREVENYLPGGVLRAFKSASYDRWLTLAEEQKDYEDLKVLFGPKLARTLNDCKLERLFHEQALRERGGQELDQFVKCISELL